ncbi:MULTISPECIES: hypothetical protein [Streptomyces]|uniref:hypothetical protein n=1 Tax=Streptomyces TaxID=1883 RepID=UPI00226F4AC3|nr:MULTISPECIES: hypothetical protein [unclassified Streptomyces]MCY0940189.1 hypothetical protein [Streptomyces sp. H34-AA3]MCZ4080836.1 hypothetical protein [Streptomyces sp. H34-S5]
MARIRTIKPEMFWSEDLAACDVTAMVTFQGLLTQADDSGRFLAHPAIIAGLVWPLRIEHTPAHVARDLDQLAAVGIICRYTGCDDKDYLHVVKWEKHQKIDRPSASRMPRCPVHQAQRMCSECGSAACPASPAPAKASAPTTAARLAGSASKDSTNTRRVLDQPVSPDSAPAPKPDPAPVGFGTAPRSSPKALQEPLSDLPGETAGQKAFDEGSTQMREGSSSGSRILDPGSVPTGREAPASGSVSEKVSAKDLVAEYVKGCRQKPPSDTRGLLGRKIKMLLDEDFAPSDIRAAMDLLRDKGLHPSVLPSLVNQVVNASPQHAGGPPSSASGAGPWASTGSAYTPYFNPAPAPTTFGGSL